MSSERPAGPRGPAGPQGPQGPPGPAGKSAFPDVYAHVASDGTVLKDSRGVTGANVRRLAKGLYCLHGLPSRLRSAAVTLGTVATGATATAVLAGTPTCPFRIGIYTSARKRVNAPFYVQFM